MHRFTIQDNTINFCFDIDKTKILYGNNYILKKKIINYLDKVINKIGNSEYDLEENNEVIVKYDESLLNPNEFSIYYLDNNFDLEQDFNLGTKSLSLKYLENKLKDIEYEEIFTTIKCLLEDLNNNYIKDNTELTIGDISLQYMIEEVTLKQMIKLMSGNMYNNYKLKNHNINYDLNLEIQLKLINEIVKYSSKNFIIVIDNKLTNNILDIINNNQLDNLFYIILNNIVEDDLNKYLLVNRNILDLADQEKTYQFLLDYMPFHFEINEIAKLFIDYINKEINQKTIELSKQL